MIRETLELLRDKEWLIDDKDINISKELRTNNKRKKLTR